MRRGLGGGEWAENEEINLKGFWERRAEEGVVVRD